MVAWSVELFNSDIKCEPRITIKAQALADFLVEMVDNREHKESRCTLSVDGASSTKGSGADVILEKKGKIIIKLLIKFNFWH